MPSKYGFETEDDRQRKEKAKEEEEKRKLEIEFAQKRKEDAEAKRLADKFDSVITDIFGDFLMACDLLDSDRKVSKHGDTTWTSGKPEYARYGENRNAMFIALMIFENAPTLLVSVRWSKIEKEAALQLCRTLEKATSIKTKLSM